MATMTKKKPAKRKGSREKPTGITATARAVGISRRQLLRNYESGCPRDATAEEIIRWRAENVRKQPTTRRPDTADTDEPQTIAEARLQLIKRQTLKEAELAEKHKIANQVRAGELLERETVERELSLLLGRLRHRIQALGLQCANVVPAELKATVKTLVDEQARICLKELADSANAVAGGGADDDETED